MSDCGLAGVSDVILDMFSCCKRTCCVVKFVQDEILVDNS